MAPSGAFAVRAPEDNVNETYLKANGGLAQHAAGVPERVVVGEGHGRDPAVDDA